MIRDLHWGDVAELKYGRSLREYRDSPTERHCFRVFGTNGPIGWHESPLVNGAGIIIGRKGAYRGVHFSAEPFFVIDTAYFLEIRDPDVHLKWAFYQLLTVDINRMDSGSAIPSTKREDFNAVPVSIPPIAKQKRIAEILSAYDDLIANNGRRMVLLEEAARQLYQEWFVRLRFPGHEHTSTADRLPAGWGWKRIGELTTKIGSGATPRGGEASYKTTGIPLIRSQNVYNDGFREDGLAFIDEAQAAALAHVMVQSRDLLLNITGASVARCCMAPERLLPARVNQHVMIVRINEELADHFFVHNAINSDENKRKLLSYAQKGSTREALTKEMVTNFPIKTPPYALMRRYGAFAGACFSQRDVLASQNARLRRARDLLLPRLMSGEIEV